jgi:hypothetical protein
MGKRNKPEIDTTLRGLRRLARGAFVGGKPTVEVQRYRLNGKQWAKVIADSGHGPRGDEHGDPNAIRIEIQADYELHARMAMWSALACIAGPDCGGV